MKINPHLLLLLVLTYLRALLVWTVVEKKTNYIENLNATLDNVKRDSHLIDGTDGRRWYNDIDLGEITSDSYIRLGIRGVEPWLNTISIEEAEFLIIL